MDGGMSATELEARLKAALSDCKGVRIARYVEAYDINTDEMKVRAEITFSVPDSRTTKAK